MKILIINDGNKDSFLLKSIKKFLKSKSYLYEGWNPYGVLKSESPNFVFFDLEESVNGDNVVNMMNSFDVYCRLRINIIYPLQPNFSWIQNYSSRIIWFFKNQFRHKNPFGPTREAYLRR